MKTINCNGTIICVDASRLGELADILHDDWEKNKHVHEGYKNFEEYIYAHATALVKSWGLQGQEKRDVIIEIATIMKDLFTEGRKI